MARFQGLELLVEVHAADEAHHVQPGVLGQGRGVLGDLHHQLAGRRDDQRARFAHVAFLGWRRLLQLGDDRDEEGGGLAGAGLGAADGVLAAQGVTQHLGLDRRAVRETEVVDGMHQLVGELEVMEAGLAFLRLDHEVFRLPQAGLGLGLAFAARFVLGRFLGGRCGGGRFGLDAGFAGGGLALRLRLGRGGCGRRRRRDAGSRSDGLRRGVSLAEYFLECLEHGRLVNWLRNVRPAV